jgi:hypothetical protein
VFDRSNATRANQPGPRDVPHLLEWHSWHCVGLADACENARVKKILRLLAADLAIEAETLRRQWQERDMAELMPDGERSHFLRIDMRGERPASRLRFAADRA